ncbi:uncharacterized protein BO87DRAFT_375051 [Aspergillus neoniger CBS 115656]|uniref:Uncharacterized protein n=1 Tax=Aspergillus neoniger (strain CBS 115656) TaxID=1448310 RepID=A0A318YVW3_ASPNB|nr:hypothetical protein BO87DRAFT_375051 [Aspergillus neoniger CBS 115656]PYH36040.1 hypothetical protein BO87DRAFT_375051 [Aspergillus neoniger CBS 115656]
MSRMSILQSMKGGEDGDRPTLVRRAQVCLKKSKQNMGCCRTRQDKRERESVCV